MKQIITNNIFCTGINSEFNSINSIEIDDIPFAEGGFGAVYNCISINGNKINSPQVIKIFKENYPGSSDHNAATILRLQKKIADLNINITNEGNFLLKEYPAFKGVPQFSFKGSLNGITVQGYSANNLTKLGFEEFDKILGNDKLLARFYEIPPERRIYFAYQLTSAFKILDEFKYIHADLKPGAIFLNLDTQELAIIDYDSGVITENQNDEPTTWGAPGDWVAPEIYDQLNKVKPGTKIKVDFFTDRWSVAIGVNYLITGIHPLFFLTELGPRITKSYFGSTQWPNADINASYFCKENLETYNKYIEFITIKIPPQIKEKIANTINFGYRNSVARTSYKDWEIALKSIQKPPDIKFFTVSKKEILEGEEIVVAWNAENAISVEIENIGIFGSIDKKAIRPKKDIIYKVKFLGYYGEVIEKVEIKVTPAPKFKELNLHISKLKKGESTTLNWEINNISEARLIGIEQNAIEISKKGNLTIKPDQTTLYTFQVKALDQKTTIEKQILIEVFEEGNISFFKADRQFVFPTIPVKLSWEVKNATKVEIEGVGIFPFSGNTLVQPTIDTIYKLCVTDNFGIITKDLQIKMLPLPLIEKLLIPTPTIVSNSLINISVPNYSTKPIASPQLRTFNKSNFQINLDSRIFTQSPDLIQADYKIEEVGFIKRLKKIILLIQSEFTNEKNRRYVIKK